MGDRTVDSNHLKREELRLFKFDGRVSSFKNRGWVPNTQRNHCSYRGSHRPLHLGGRGTCEAGT